MDGYVLSGNILIPEKKIEDLLKLFTEGSLDWDTAFTQIDPPNPPHDAAPGTDDASV